MVCIEMVNGTSVTVDGDDCSKVAGSVAGRGSTIAAGFFTRIEASDGQIYYLNPQQIVRIYAVKDD
jgi:hypothetical protein